MMMSIVVVGSINMDIVNEVKKHPLPGETIHGFSTKYFPGGKGANQAVAAARTGGEVTMIGAVGDDAFAQVLIASLEESGIYVRNVLHKQGNSGLAFITVDEHGENSIILSAGANGLLKAEDIWGDQTFFDSTSIVLLQNEIPWDTNLKVMKEASKKGARILFNPAPAMKVPKELFPFIHTLILNETEAEVLTGLQIGYEYARAEAAITELLNSGIQSVILTLGSKGCLYMGSDRVIIACPAFQVKAVDTTAAGDTFIGAYACALMEGTAISESLRFASAAAAITVTREGAQASIPTKAQVNAFLI
jgi:ribokinase